MFQKLQAYIAPRHFALLGICVLSYVYLSSFRYDLLGIEEGAARALLLNWSIVHQVINPVALFGVPDLRALLFIILDLHWAGSLIAAKVFSFYILLATVLMLYRWSDARFGSETSMMACVLLLLAPISFMQTDAIAGGIYLLGAFAAIHFLNQNYLDSPNQISSQLFLLGLFLAAAISIHPMGLAAALALAWQWYGEKEQLIKRRNLFITLAAVTALMLLLRWGWPGLEHEYANPLHLLGNAIAGSDLLSQDSDWALGLVLANLLAFSLLRYLWQKRYDTLSLTLFLASLMGLLQGDQDWSFIAYTSLLFFGIPALIELNQRFGWRSLLGQRGLVFATVFVFSFASMLSLRDFQQIRLYEFKSDSDLVIAALADEANDRKEQHFLAASQWPARSMLACKRDVLPLPSAEQDAQKLLQKIDGITHLAFSSIDPANEALSRNAASLTQNLETLIWHRGYILLKARAPEEALTNSMHSGR